MPNFTVSNDIDTFMQSANKAEMLENTGAAAALARREFSGGVRFDGTAGNNPFNGNFTTYKDSINTLSFILTRGSVGSTQYVYAKGISYGSLNGGVEVFFNSTNKLNVRFRQVGTASTHYNVVSDRAFLEGESFLVEIKIDDTGANLDVGLRVNGEDEALSVAVAHTGTFDDTALTWHGLIGTSSGFVGSMRDFTAFNTALTASQALALHNLGPQGFLAEYPELKWGGEVALPTATQSACESFSGASSTGFTWLNSSGSCFAGWVLPRVLPVGSRILVEFNLDTVDASPLLAFRSTTSGDVTTVTNATVEGLQEYTTTGYHSFVFTLSSNSNLISFTEGDTPSNLVVSGFKVTPLGALAYLPLNDDCRQLKDLSPNRYDAIASATGVTHMKQAERHSFRDDNATGTGSPYLIAAADILAANEVVTGVVVDGDYYAATGTQTDSYRRIQLVINGSHILVRRSNGTSVDTIATITPASTTDFSITVLTSRY